MQSDEKSREIFVNIFCLRAAPHLAWRSYEDMCVRPQYFPEDIISVEDCQNVVDCGAYIGDTLEEFVKLTEGKFEKYYAFELDRNNFVQLQKQAEKLDVGGRFFVFLMEYGAGIRTFPMVLWHLMTA